MTHMIKVHVKVDGSEDLIVFYVSDMPRISASVKRNLENFNVPYPAWVWAVWIEDGVAQCIYREDAVSMNLAQDTIDVALNITGYDISDKSQFEKAHALMDMAQELKALKPFANATFYIREK